MNNMNDPNPSHVLNEPENPGRRLLSVEETAIYLGLSPRTIYNAVARKSKRPFPVKPKRIGKLVKFDIKDLEQYVESL
ncbi:MAG: helix-turn-helix transcriptional regulator [Candidatus Hodarchaeota archaeon]